jgi:hypothetical protein
MTHTRKRIRKLSTAVFRGSRSEYNFDVYPITPAITDHAVVFIFSRRKLDKNGHAHHAVSCVGETQSIVSEIKKHRRSRCVKGNEANVVCILKEGDRTTRAGVLEDIASVRAFSCVRGKFKPTVNAKLDVVKNTKSAKVLPFKQLTKTNSRPDVAANSSVAGVRKPNKKSAVKGNIEFPTKRKITGSKAERKGRTPESGKRVSGRVDSDGGQRRLSDKKRPAGRTAKTRIAGGARSRTKLAA